MKKLNPYAFLCDVETTGFSPEKNDVIQMAGIIIDLRDMEIKSKFNEFCRPQNPDQWSYGAERVHGIKLSEAMKFQSSREMGIKFLHFIKHYKTKDNLPLEFIYHGIRDFDYNFVKCNFRKSKLLNSFYKVLDQSRITSTVEMANTYKRATGLNNSKLDTLAHHFGIKFNHHEAMSDVMATYKIWKIFKEMNPKNQIEMEFCNDI